MIKIAVCDDDLYSREQLTAFCRRYFADSIRDTGASCDYEITEYESGLSYVEQAAEADILLLDIEMEGMDGIALKDLLERRRTGTRILFVSSHEEAVPEAFGWHVHGFLTKPLQYDWFARKMRKALESLAYERKCILIRGVGGERKVYLTDILYVEALRKYTRVYVCKEGQPLFDGRSIREWKEEVAEYGFAMSHKSYLVNLGRVRQVESDVLLDEGARVPVSRRLRNEFKEQYFDHLVRTARLEGETYV